MTTPAGGGGGGGLLRHNSDRDVQMKTKCYT